MWKTLPEPWDDYEINDEGIVRNTARTKVVAQSLDKTGYMRFGLKTKGGMIKHCSVHQFVALAFIGPRPKGMIVHHIDSNRMNNSPNNLLYVTHKENHRYAVMSGRKSNTPLVDRKKALKGSQIWKAIINEEMAWKIKQELKKAKAHRIIAEELNVSLWVIRDISRGKTWKHIGEENE